MYVRTDSALVKPRQRLGETVVAKEPSIVRDVLVTTLALVVGTVVVEKLRKTGVL